MPVSTYGQHLQGQPEFSARPRPILRNFCIPCWPQGVRAGPSLLWAARFWLLRLLALGFLGLRPFLCIRLGRRLGLREATAHTTQHSHEHLITPLLTSTPTSAASMMRFMVFHLFRHPKLP